MILLERGYVKIKVEFPGVMDNQICRRVKLNDDESELKVREG